MKWILVSVFFCDIVYGGKTFIRLPALDANYPVEIGRRYIRERECIKKLDAVLTARWTEELNYIPTTDLFNIPKIPWEDKDSRFTKYNSFVDEWLMEDGSPIKKVNECVQSYLSDPKIPEYNRGDLRCLTQLLASNSMEEIYHQRDSEKLVNISSAGQLPFRKFISFYEIVELIFQNREPKTWTNLETLLYAHAHSYAHTDADKSHRKYLVDQNCDWINGEVLREASSEVARLNEFTSQVRHKVNELLAGRLVKEWNLDTILPAERYQLWLQSHQEMMSQLEREVEALRKQNKDAQWLCNYAAELATNFTDVQSRILLPENKSSIHLDSADVASMARAIEIELSKVNDTRQIAIKKIADEQDDGTRCLSSLVRLVENHRRYEIASAFIDEEYEFPEIYCKNTFKNLGLTRFTFCNCIGSFCISNYLAAIFAEEYVLVKGSDGIYRIVRSGIRSGRKVWHCHTLANGGKN